MRVMGEFLGALIDLEVQMGHERWGTCMTFDLTC